MEMPLVYVCEKEATRTRERKLDSLFYLMCQLYSALLLLKCFVVPLKELEFICVPV